MQYKKNHRIPSTQVAGRAVNENLKQAFKHTAQLIVSAKNGIYIPVTWCNDVNIDLKEKPIPLLTMHLTVTPIELPLLDAEISGTVTYKRYVADAFSIEVKRSLYDVLEFETSLDGTVCGNSNLSFAKLAINLMAVFSLLAKS